MKKSYLPALIICLGMVLTQLFFTLLVYRSNLNLYYNTLRIIDAGYLPVPNQHILPGLQRLSTAYKGALFFTLTIGIVLPALVYAFAWAWDRGYRRNKAFLTILSGFVIFCMVMVNRNGFNPIVTLWFLTIYFTVFKLTLRSLDCIAPRLSTKRLLAHILLGSLLAGAWMTAPSGIDFFKIVRDHVLLSNKMGEAVTYFYYRYSPYPTEACKPLFKKQLKTCRIESEPEAGGLERIQGSLLQYDYLPVNADVPSDVVLRVSEKKLDFEIPGRARLTADATDFLKTPGEFLYRLSRRCDRQEFTRRLLAFSIKYGLPVVLYICMFGLINAAVGRFFKGGKSFAVTAACCLAIGLGAVIAFRLFAPVSIPASQLKDALQSDIPGLRVAALRTISARKLDPYDYAAGSHDEYIHHIPERLWWVKSLGNSRHRDAPAVLLEFLDDPHPIVSCMAYDALRGKGYRSAVLPILKRIRTSRDWYVQGYAYQALRSLGWEQKISG